MRFHTCSLEERGRGAGEEAYLHSLRVFRLLKKKNRHFTGHVINQRQLSPCMILKRHEQAGEKSDSELLGFGITTCLIQEVLLLMVPGGKDEGKG